MPKAEMTTAPFTFPKTVAICATLEQAEMLGIDYSGRDIFLTTKTDPSLPWTVKTDGEQFYATYGNGTGVAHTSGLAFAKAVTHHATT